VWHFCTIDSMTLYWWSFVLFPPSTESGNNSSVILPAYPNYTQTPINRVSTHPSSTFLCVGGRGWMVITDHQLINTGPLATTQQRLWRYLTVTMTQTHWHAVCATAISKSSRYPVTMQTRSQTGSISDKVSVSKPDPFKWTSDQRV